MPNFNGDVIFLDTSGQVRATNGDLTLRGDDTGLRDVIAGSGISLRPDKNLVMDLGRDFMRWRTLYAGSGNFTQRPTVNNSGVLLQGEVTAISNSSVALSFTPTNGIDFTLIHGLGTTDWNWAMWRTDVSPIKAVIPNDVTPSGVNGIRIQLDTAMSGKIVLTSCGASGVATGAVGMFRTLVDFGATPIESTGFLVTNPFVTPSSILMGSVAYTATPNKDLDEMEMDALDLKFGEVNFGGFTIFARGLDGLVHGEFYINYSIANI